MSWLPKQFGFLFRHQNILKAVKGALELMLTSSNLSELILPELPEASRIITATQIQASHIPWIQCTSYVWCR